MLFTIQLPAKRPLVILHAIESFHDGKDFVPLQFFLLSAQPFYALILAKDGRATSVLVIADARDLQMWIRKLGGAELPILTESEINDDGMALVFIGDTIRSGSRPHPIQP